MNRIRVAWSGSGIVGPAASTFYTIGVEPAALRAALSTFFNSWKASLPSAVSVVIPPEGDVVDVATGEITDGWSDGAGIVVSGTGQGKFAQGVGVRTVWLTNGRTRSRRVRGSTFMVPVVPFVFDDDGTINAASRQFFQDAALELQSDLAGGMVIWTRPVNGVGGKYSEVSGADVPDKVSWLASRRT